MKTISLFKISNVLVLVALIIACQKEPDQIIETNEGSIFKIYAGSVKGYKDGPALEAQFTEPTHLAVGPDKSLFVVDHMDRVTYPLDDPGSPLRFSTRIRKISSAGVVSTFFDVNSSDQGVKRINGIAVDKDGYVFFTDEHQIKKISPDGKKVTLVAGDGSRDSMKDGPALSASFYVPSGLSFDKNGCLYIMDTGNNAIRLYSNGKVSTLAGGNRIYQDKCEYEGCSEDNRYINGTGRNAYFDFPQFITLDDKNNVYVSGGRWELIRKISPSGVVTTFFGSIYFRELGGRYAFNGVTFYKDNIYVNNLLSRGSVEYSTNKISLRGDSTRLFFTKFPDGPRYDGYLPIENGLNYPTGNVVIDNVLYIANTGEHTIRKIALE